MRDWMRRLAAHYGRFRSEYPEDQLLVVFDIDGTILDMRHMVRHVLLWFDRAYGSDWFHGLTADDVTVHENQVDQLLRDMALPAPVAERAYRWYVEQRWRPEAVLAAHRPYQGVLDVIRWFQPSVRSVRSWWRRHGAASGALTATSENRQRDWAAPRPTDASAI